MNQETPPSGQLILNFPAEPDYTFDSFIETPGSELALKAAKSICEKGTIDTLFISGGAGLGKTHLLRAIGNCVSRAPSRATAVYLASGRFVECMQGRDTNLLESALEEIFRADVFLLDDVHHIAGQQEAQERLHYVFNTLRRDGKRMAFTASRTPDKIAGLADFITSRLRWGMMVHLKPIDDATSARILQKISGDLGLEIPPDVISFLLQRLPRDFHSLRRAVDTINATSYRKKKKVTLPLAKDALGLN